MLLRVTMTQMIPKRLPNVYIPTLYFAEGLPYTIVMLVSGVFLKNLGVDNVFIGYTSWLSLPWIIKFAWAPVVDTYATKRSWIVWMELALAAVICVFASFTSSGLEKSVGIVLLALIAIASATQDVAVDGFYLDALKKDQQALYVGVRNAVYKLAWLFGSGGLVVLAGYLQERHHWQAGFSWLPPFLIAAAIMLFIGIFHSWYLPHLPKAQSDTAAPAAAGERFLDVFKSYFTQPGIAPVVFYIVTFRLGDALMLKQAPLFLMDAADKGGLAIPLSQIGVINGTVGVIFLLVGGIAGGVLIAKQGLKKWFWPLSILMNGALPLYWLLALFKPALPWVYAVNSFEQLAYGFGTAAYTVFLLTTIKNAEYRAAHYAITTAMMALGVMIPQLASGLMQSWLHYDNFFLVASLLALPGLAAIPFLPLWKEEDIGSGNGKNKGDGDGNGNGQPRNAAAVGSR